MSATRTLPFSKIPLPDGEEFKPGPRKDEKTNAALARSFLVDPTLIVRQSVETNANTSALEETKRKTAAELQREKIAEQAKAVELARYGRGVTAGSYREQTSPDNYDDLDRSQQSPVQTRTRFEGIDSPNKGGGGGVPKVDTMNMSQTNASWMSGQETKVVTYRQKWQQDELKGGALSGRMTEEMMEEHISNLEKLEELKEHLVHMNETREKEKEERKRRLQGMHIFERLDDKREERILTRHEKRQREWEEFRTRMVKKLGKHHDPDNLVFNRAEEWRAMLEEKDLLMKAQPIESRQGSNLWQMSLRDAWTRYIAVGGPFSGLEMPYIDRPELRPDSIYTIRNPFNDTTQYPTREVREIDSRTHQDLGPLINPETKQPYTRADLGITVHPSMNLNKTKKSRQHLPDEQTHKEYAKHTYRKALAILQPTEVAEFDELKVEGSGYQTTFERQAHEMELQMAEEEEKRRREEEKQRRKASRGKSRHSEAGTTTNSVAGSKSAANTVASVADGGAVAAHDGAASLELEPLDPDEDEPLMQFFEERLLFEARQGKPMEAIMTCMNVGTYSVYYSWSRRQMGVETAVDGLQRFFMKDVAGSILPGKSKTFVFNFKSEKPGVFMEEWTFSGTPNVAGCQHKVLLKGVCVPEDTTRAKRAELEAQLAAAERDHTVDEMVRDLVEHIGTPRTKPRVLAEDPDVDRQVFIAQNKEAQIYYSNTTLKLFRSLADSTFELLNFPMELRKWDSSLNSLKRLLYAIEDDYERERHIVQFNEIMKNAGIPPTSTAMFNSICYELVSELADSIPDMAEGIRKKLALPNKNLQPKREDAEVDGAEFGKLGPVLTEERMLTYTTEPPPTMNLWHYDNHLLLIGGPPVKWFYPDSEENPADPAKDPVTEEDRVGNIKLKKKLVVELWENEGDAPKGEGEEGAGEGAEEEGERPKVEDGRDAEDTGRLEFEYLLRLNDSVYYKLACMTERMALLNVEADLRSQVIAQVVIELDKAAADEIRTLIKEDKVDEARKIDPAKYQNIVDLDQVFRQVMKEEEEEEQRRKDRAAELEAQARAEAAQAGAGDAIAAVGQNGPELVGT